MRKVTQAGTPANQNETSGPTSSVENPSLDDAVRVINMIIIKLEQLTGRVEQLELNQDYDEGLQ